MRKRTSIPKRIRAQIHAAERRATRARRQVPYTRSLAPEHRTVGVLDSIVAPRRLSLIDNPHRTVPFLLQVQQARRLHVDLSEVEHLTPETAVALTAAVARSGIRGSPPRNARANAVLARAGFYEHVRVDFLPPTIKGAGRMFRFSGRGEVDGATVQSCVETAATSVLGKQFHSPSYRLLMECCTNTANHAAPEPTTSWWCSVYVKSNHCAAFTFVDYGAGILNTVGVRDDSFLGVIRNASGSLLGRIMRGEVGTRTDQPGRGRGLPDMARRCSQGKIHGLVVVANRAVWHSERDRSITLNEPFPGTLIYWEIRR